MFKCRSWSQRIFLRSQFFLLSSGFCHTARFWTILSLSPLALVVGLQMFNDSGLFFYMVSNIGLQACKGRLCNCWSLLLAPQFWYMQRSEEDIGSSRTEVTDSRESSNWCWNPTQVYFIKVDRAFKLWSISSSHPRLKLHIFIVFIVFIYLFLNRQN